jgi:hypothetical protein
MASSSPELDLEFLTKRKDNIKVPKGIDTPMCFYGDKCKLVRCTVLGHAYGMTFFMCVNYADDPINPFDRNLIAKGLTTFLDYSFIISVLLFVDMFLKKTPPPLCDFMQWLDTEQFDFDKRYVEGAGRDARER